MNNYDKIYKYAMSLIFILFICLIVFLHIIIPDKVFSSSENRMLEQKPKISIQHILDGRFTRNFEKYVSDQFPLRDLWIGIKSDVERAIGKKENNNVYIGKDGQLFQKFNAPTYDTLEDRINSINKFASLNTNVNKYFMLVPNATKILEDNLPKFASPDDEYKYIKYVSSHISKDINFIDVFNVLDDNKDKYIFYRTDHHWTTEGAYYAYTSLAASMGFVPKSKQYYDIKTVTSNFYGSLYSEGGFRHIKPDSIQLYIPKSSYKYNVWYSDTDETYDSIYDMNNLEKKDKYTVFLNGNHPLLKITVDNNTNKNLLIIKDSYANCFVPFLMEHYSSIYMVDPRYYKNDLKNLINSNKIDDVLILYNVDTFFNDSSVNDLAY